MIPTKVHGIIDYVYGAALIASPYVFGFADGTVAQYALMAFGLGAIAYSLLTNYELGAVRIIAMPLHLMLDVVAGVVLITLPWVIGFADRIWWPYVFFGALSVIVPVLTERKPPYNA